MSRALTFLLRTTTAVCAVLALTRAAAADPALVVADLNLREGPGPQYAAILTIPGGSNVEVIGCDGGWCQVQFGGQSGYVSQQYLDLGGEPPAAVAPGPYPPPPIIDEEPPAEVYPPVYGPGPGIYPGPYRRPRYEPYERPYPRPGYQQQQPYPGQGPGQGQFNRPPGGYPHQQQPGFAPGQGRAAPVAPAMRPGQPAPQGRIPPGLPPGRGQPPAPANTDPNLKGRSG